MGLYQNFCQTKNDEDFKRLYYKTQGWVYRKIFAFGISGHEVEDAKQEIYQELFKAANNYNSELKDEIPFCMMVTDRALINYLKKKNRQKHKCLNEAYSLDIQLGIQFDDEEDNIIDYYDRTGSDYNLEDEIIIKDEIRIHYKKIKESLTDMELKVWQTDIITQSPDGCKWSNMKEIARITGYRVKQVDNALQRIRGKIAKIMDEKGENNINEP